MTKSDLFLDNRGVCAGGCYRPDEPVEIFIGILSSANHFAERMGVRKTWMSAVLKPPNRVARFFVALHGRKEVNVELKKEAEFFGDIVFVPYLDNYDLVVMKTLAICEYGDLAYDSLHCCLAVNIFSYLGSMIAFYGQSDQYSCCRVPHLTSQH
ncbi:unnamed protein product [Miscanthus lutarioriparius]|uniref:Hexosyltransferase n=1 Tax=Miscanthus lutarioriparius TaxID=422564 RepID=A0A811PPT1_9POAL|nr:unnamed protein product [Miscanthus lutarioriparius]